MLKPTNEILNYLIESDLNVENLRICLIFRHLIQDTVPLLMKKLGYKTVLLRLQIFEKKKFTFHFKQ